MSTTAACQRKHNLQTSKSKFWRIMCPKTPSCTVCLQSNPELISAGETDDNNIKWSCKLTFCVPEVMWNDDCSICCACTVQLHMAYAFRNLCLQSNGSQVHWETQPKTESAEIDFTCYYCNGKFSTKLALIEHIHSHTDNRCSLCDTHFTTNTQLQLHNRQIHHETTNRLSRKNQRQTSQVLACTDFKEECGDFKTEEVDLGDDYDDATSCSSPPDKIYLEDNFKPHRKVTRRATFFCDECNHSFTSSKKLLSHALSAHGFDPSVIKPFRCDKCDSKFSTSSNLLQHKKYHVGKRTHICTFCGKGYITKSDLNTHEKQHLNKREYQCVGCPKTFNTNKDLRSHRLVVHTDPSLWNYVCSFCQKRFPIKSNLDQHMRRHTGDKRFGCHICEKRFVDKVVMQKHVKSHSNFRAFKCELCDKEYKDDKVLQVHLAKVHGVGDAKIPVRVKKYFCHVCPKSYFAKNKLTRHVFSHTGEKPYVCHVCNRKFTDKSYVKQHLKTAHNIFEADEN